jgi:hypothetical protein
VFRLILWYAYVGMGKPIDPKAFAEWRRGMQEAGRIIESEKTEWLQRLTPEESIQIYLSLWELGNRNRCRQEPSEMLVRVMRVFQRYLEAQKQNEPAS